MIDLTQPIPAKAGQPAPLVITVVTTPRTMEFVGGVPGSATKREQYVLFSALPEELRQRVKLAVEALASAG
jgi:hypothetical protein